MTSFKAIFALATFGLLASTEALAQQCLTVSGGKAKTEQESGALHELHPGFLKGRARVNGMRCKVFDSWAELRAYVDGKTQGRPNVGPTESLVIAQVTHGHEGGIAETNAGEVPAEEIIAHIDEISKNRKVFVDLLSCNSGDLLRKKLVHDELHPELKSIDNACILAASTFGHGADGSPRDPIGTLEHQARKGMTAEQIFLKSDEGIISSAPWNEAGFTSYFMGKEIQETQRVLASIQAYGDRCPSALFRKSAHSDFASMLDPYLEGVLKDFGSIPDVTLTPEDLQTLQETISENIDSTRKAADDTKDPQEKARLLAEVKCEQLILSELARFKFEAPAIPYRDLIVVLNSLEESETFQDYFRLMEHHLKPSWSSLQFRTGRGEALHLLRKFAAAEIQMRALYATHDLNEIWAQGAEGPLSSKNSEGLRPRMLLATVLGDAFEMQSDKGIYSKTPAPLQAVFAFVRGGLATPHYSDPMDQRRRNACRQFKFE